jgi:HlyD family secretion protein
MVRTKKSNALLVGAFTILLLTGCTAQSEAIYTGTLEAEEYTISSEVGGVILMVHVENGDQVEKGDLLAEVDSSALELEIKRLEANARSIEAQLARLVKGARSEELNQIDLQILQQEEAISTLQQQYNFALDQYEDSIALHEQGAVSDQHLKEAKLKKDNNSNILEQAIKQKAVLLQKQSLMIVGATEDEINVLKSQLDAANWAIESAQDRINKTQLIATVDGVIEWVQYNPGEIYKPLTPMMTLLEEGPLWAKIFVEEQNLYQVNVGDELDIVVPHMEKPIKGKVVYIASQGEFTPKNTESRENRQEVVYEVKLELDSMDQQLKPGMLIDTFLNEVDHE